MPDTRPGLDALRDVIHRETWLTHGLPPEATCGFCEGVAAKLLAFLASPALTPSRQSEGRDAERLARAIRIVTHDNDPDSDDADNLAAALAAEYDRLHERTEP